MEEYRQASQGLVSLAQEAVRDLLSAFGPESDPTLLRDFLLQYFPEFMTTYGEPAALLGADWYDMARDLPPSAGTVRTVFAQPAKVKQSEAVVRNALGSLFTAEPDWGSFESRLLGSAQRLVLQPARETTDLMVREDIRSGRVTAVRWSRRLHPERAKSGKSCDFCKMLAGRGDVYRSAESAGAVVGRGVDSSIALDEDGNRRAGYIGGVGGGVRARGSQPLAASFHDNCHCVAVPTFYQRSEDLRDFGQGLEQFLIPIN